MITSTPYKALKWGKILVLIAAFFCCSFTLAQEKQTDSKPTRFMSRLMKNISPKQGKKYLSQVGIDTVSQIPETNMLLITAEPKELIKAREVLKIVDVAEPFIIDQISLISETNEPPASEDIEADINGLSIGTFDNPPSGETKHKAIIDLQDDSIIVIAPAEIFEEISYTIEKLQKPEMTDIVIAEPNFLAEPNEIISAKPAEKNQLESDEFFNELLDSLAEAEKVQAQLKSQKPDPKLQPETVQEIKIEQVSREPKIEEKIEVSEEELVKEGQDIEDQNDIDELTFTRLNYEPKQIEFADDTLELDLPPKLDIVRLIDLVGKHLDLDYLYDPKLVVGEVTLGVQGPIKVSELYPLLESVLKFRGFVMSRKGNLVTIVPKANVLDIDPVLLKAEKGQVKYGDVIVTRVFNLQHIDTTSAKNLLAQMKLGESISEVPDAGKLIVTEYAYRMNRVEELLSMIDIAGEDKQFRFRQLKYTLAANLAEQLKTLSEQLGTVSITVAAPAAQPTTPDRRRGRKPAPKKPTPTKAPTPAPGETAVFLDADERTNRILMIGLKHQLDLVEQLIDSLDVEQQVLSTLRLYDIQYVGPEEVKDKLAELGIISGSTRQTSSRQRSGRITQQKGKQPAAPETTAATITEEGLVGEPQVVIIESTNSLLVNATAEQHAQISTIIAYVDSEPEQAAINYVIYPLENQDPEELAGVLNQLVQETIQETAGEKDSKVVRTTTASKVEDDITIIADPTTYSLVVYASKKNQQWISSLIRELDQYRPQVLLDVTLVQITKDDAFNFDLELLSSIPDMSYVSGKTNVTTAIVDLLQAPESNRGKFLELQSIGGQGKGFFGDERINALLTVMQNKKYGRVMARPKLLVNDNQEGIIKTTDTTYVIKVEQVVQPGDPPVITETVTYPDYPAGITLKIKPHISTGDMLRLEIELNRSGFTEVPDGEKPPDKADADVATTVTVPNNSTIILGGMEKIDQSKNVNKVPLLSDIPLIGGVFRSIANAGGHDKLYIFVKAHILRPGSDLALEDLKKVSQKNRETFESLEAEMQEYEDWPGIKPEPMDPLKILEAD